MALFVRVGRGARFSNEGPGDTDVRRSDIRGAAAQTPLADARTTVAGKTTPCCLSFECFRTSTSRLLASVGDNRVFARFSSLFFSLSLCALLSYRFLWRFLGPVDTFCATPWMPLQTCLITHRGFLIVHRTRPLNYRSHHFVNISLETTDFSMEYFRLSEKFLSFYEEKFLLFYIILSNYARSILFCWDKHRDISRTWFHELGLEDLLL